MIACYFRVIQDGEPVGWVGFAFAQNMRELFWQVDAHVDPYRVEVKTAHQGSACVLQTHLGDDDYDETDQEVIGHASFDDDDWKKPKWVTDPDFVV